MGKLIVLDGLDASGKATQTGLLFDALCAINGAEQVRKISFPDYSQPSSALVKMYLNGELSKDLNEINAFAASSFYAVDRYASYKMAWEKDYLADKIIIADRYTTSNAIHQMAKLPHGQWEPYLEWLYDYEFEKMCLPRPDQVFFLNMHPNTSRKLLLKRYEGDASKQDLHEANFEYLLQCRESALYCARRFAWTVIDCCDGPDPLPIEQIHEKIMDALL